MVKQTPSRCSKAHPSESTRTHEALHLEGLDLLDWVSQQFTCENDLSKLLSRVLDTLIAIAGADSGSVELAPSPVSELRQIVHRTSGVSAPAEPRAADNDAFIRSLPLRGSSGDVQGILWLRFEGAHRPTAHQLKLLELLARQAAERISHLRFVLNVQRGEARLRMVLAAARMGVWEWNLSNGELAASPECLEIAGLRHFDRRIESFLRIVHPQDSARVRAMVNRSLPDHVGRTAEFRIRRNGETRWVSCFARRSEEGPGRSPRLAGTVCDVTDRKLLERHVLEIAEAERRRLGSELHDGTVQELTGLTLLAGAVLDMLDATPRRAAKEGDVRELDEARFALLRDRTAKLAERLATANRHVHGLARGVMPVQIEAEGLRSALEELAVEAAALGGVPCHCECESVQVDDNGTALQLYRIAQEALANALRHSRASEISLTVRQLPQAVVLQVRDNGLGIAVDPAIGEGTHPARGIGIRTMSYRAELIGGALQVEPGHPRGTTVTCTLAREHSRGDRRPREDSRRR